jgi:hypothetical protein
MSEAVAVAGDSCGGHSHSETSNNNNNNNNNKFIKIQEEISKEYSAELLLSSHFYHNNKDGIEAKISEITSTSFTLFTANDKNDKKKMNPILTISNKQKLDKEDKENENENENENEIKLKEKIINTIYSQLKIPSFPMKGVHAINLWLIFILASLPNNHMLLQKLPYLITFRGYLEKAYITEYSAKYLLIAMLIAHFVEYLYIIYTFSRLFGKDFLSKRFLQHKNVFLLNYLPYLLLLGYPITEQIIAFARKVDKIRKQKKYQ